MSTFGSRPWFLSIRLKARKLSYGMVWYSIIKSNIDLTKGTRAFRDMADFRSRQKDKGTLMCHAPKSKESVKD